MTFSARSAGEAVVGLGVRAGEALAGIADRALEVGLHLAKWGAVVVGSAALYGVAHLNDQLEQTTISLAAISQAQGFSSTFKGGMALAGDQIGKMKQDVKTLPGDLGQLSDMMKTIATPAAQAGASMDSIRALAGKTMLTSAILGVPQEVASREMAQLLSGRAGAHNILGTRLGLVGEDAKAFNASSPEQRLARINAEMGKYQGAADRFGNSFVANWTTLKDNIKYVLLAPATAPLFEAVKDTMVRINAYFDEHKDKINEIVDTVGGKLADAWDLVVGKFRQIEPMLAKIGGWLMNLDPAKVGQALSSVGAGLLGAKVLGGGVSAVSHVAEGAMRSGLLDSILGGGGAADAAAGLGEAVVGVGAAAEGASAALGPLALVTLPAVGAAVAGVSGEVDALTDSSSKYHAAAVKAAEDMAGQTAELAQRSATLMKPMRDWWDQLGVEMTQFFANQIGDINALLKPITLEHGPKEGIDHSDVPLFVRAMEFDTSVADGSSASAKNKIPRVNVTNHVTINVQSNQEPSRIARLVEERLKQKVIYPTASKHAPVFDGLGAGS